MIRVLAVSGVLAFAMAGPIARAQEPPGCVTTAQKSEVRELRSITPAPEIAPSSGPAGTAVTIVASGFEPGAIVTVAAIYGEGDCTIVGFGDVYLGQTTAGADGGIRFERAWPVTFEPLFGRDAFDPQRLPGGRYWLVAMPCADRGACSLANGSTPGGPFELVDGGASSTAVPAAIAGSMSVAVGVALARRRKAARRRR